MGAIQKVERAESLGTIQEVMEFSWAISKLFDKTTGPKLEVVSSGFASEEPLALLSPQTSAKAATLIKLSHRLLQSLGDASSALLPSRNSPASLAAASFFQGCPSDAH